LLFEDLLRRREVETRERRPADRRNGAEPDKTGDTELLNLPLSLDSNGLADLEALLVGGRRVHDDLA
jgi:hypothetical protein